MAAPPALQRSVLRRHRTAARARALSRAGDLAANPDPKARILKGEIRMSDDHSPGDGRQPYSDRGGPEGRHVQTHDVRREELTNPVGPQTEDSSFAVQLAPVET